MSPSRPARRSPGFLRRPLLTLGLILGLGLEVGVAAQGPPPPPAWGGLQPAGAVGFRVLRVEDETRAYGPLPDAGEWEFGARPLQLGVWYPAAPGDVPDPVGSPSAAEAGQPMILRDVVRLLATELHAGPATSEALRSAERGLLRGPIDPYLAPEADAEIELQRVLDLPLLARRNAAAAAGAFPIILHTGVLHTQVLLNEYLASHGYVVIGVPLMGTSPAWRGRGEPGPAMWDEMTRDLALAEAEVAHLPFADRDRVAVIGLLAGPGILHAMRDPRIDAVALLDAALPPGLRALPGWEPGALRAPVLELRNTVSTRSDAPVLDSLAHVGGWRVVLDSLQHSDFYPFARWVHAATPDRMAPAHAVIAQYTRAFLDAVLKDDSEAARWLERDPASHPAPARAGRVVRLHASRMPPTSRTLLTWARHGRANNVLREVQAARAADPDALPVDPGALLTVARFLWRDGLRDEAVAAARAVLVLDPDQAAARSLLEAAGATEPGR